MTDVLHGVQRPTVRLTAAERDWIRRQGVTARVLAEEQRRVRERLSASAEVTNVREQLRRDARRFERAGVRREGVPSRG
jgi:hypothetical protein